MHAEPETRHPRSDCAGAGRGQCCQVGRVDRWTARCHLADAEVVEGSLVRQRRGLVPRFHRYTLGRAAARVRATYGDTFEQLREGKATYDPAERFRVDQNIPTT